MEALRIKKLPPYLFARIEKKIEEAKAKGIDIISFGIGDPDMPTPLPIIEELCKEAHNPANHQYSPSVGMLSFREAVATYYSNTFGVSLNPKTEIINLIGSKEGIAHINFCYVDPGDLNLVPDPGYPVYGIGTLLAGGEVYTMPLLEENGYLPDLTKIPEEIAQKAKLMYISYPNNPTGAVADKNYFAEVVEFAKKYGVIVCHDAAYTEIFFDKQPPSFLEVPGAIDVGIEFGSLSKPFNMTGWRAGWAAGRNDIIEAIGRLKSNVDSGQFQAVQCAAIKALTGSKDSIIELREVYRKRRDIVVDGLNSLGWNLEKPQGSFYIWAPVPKGYTSASFAERVLDETGVIVTPGNGYGKYGEGYFRISLTIADERLQAGISRLEKNLGKVEF